MRVISWNIQWGRGADGVVNLSRIIERLHALGPADVICLQEVAEHFEGLRGGVVEDGPARIAAAFPAYEAVFAPAVDVPRAAGVGRSRFGNMLLSRWPLGQVWQHSLPSPPESGVPSMARNCIEAVILRPDGAPLRVLTTHLEYYAPGQRLAQARWLAALQDEVARRAAMPVPEREKSGPFARQPRPEAALLCGDFNCEPGDAVYGAIGAHWIDAWSLAAPGQPHPPSVGVHGAEWPDRPYCCDFAFVSAPLAGAVRALRIDAETDASDHQPVVIDIS